MSSLVDRTPQRYRALARQQWPLALVLGMLTLLQLVGMTSIGGRLLLGMPVTVALVVLAILAPLRPFRVALLASLTMTLTNLMWAVLGVTGTFSQFSLPGLIAMMAVAAYAVRYLDRRRTRVSVVAVVLALEANLLPWLRDDYRFSGLGDLLQITVITQFFVGLLLVPAVLAGLYFRGADRERDQRTEKEIQAAQQAERMALARELHDVVAHHVTGIVVQSQAARMVAENNPAAVAKALELIEHSGTEALTAMRRLVGTMRQGAAPGADSVTGQATMDLDADLRALVERAERSGIPARLDAVPGGDVPPEVGRSVLRLVQEALTNAGKHARNLTRVLVAVYRAPDGLRVLVADDGDGGVREPVGGSGGYGLVGMRERVDLLGGEFSAGPGPHHGWRVEIRLPLVMETEQT